MDDAMEPEQPDTSAGDITGRGQRSGGGAKIWPELSVMMPKTTFISSITNQTEAQVTNQRDHNDL